MWLKAILRSSNPSSGCLEFPKVATLSTEVMAVTAPVPVPQLLETPKTEEQVVI
jgi:hypothetical protein